MNPIIPSTVREAMLLYSFDKTSKKEKQALSNLRTVFRIYLLPGVIEHCGGVDDFKGDKLLEALSGISIREFSEVNHLKIFDDLTQVSIRENRIKPDIVRTTYHPALTRFLKWLSSQDWYEMLSTDVSNKFSPRVQAAIPLAKLNQGKRSTKENPYALPEELVPEQVQKELKVVRHFCTAKEVFDRQDSQIRPNAFRDNVERHTFQFLGWLHTDKKIPLHELSIYLFLRDSQDSDQEGLRLFKEFIAWGINERGNTYGWALDMAKAPLNIAKARYASQSKRGEYRDIEIIAQIRLLLNRFADQYEPERLVSLQEKKEVKDMDFEQAVEIVHFLRRCCAPYRHNHCKRSELAVMRSWLRYLLCAILTYCPIRQREIRELTLGGTLFRDDGYRIILKPEDNKTHAPDRDFCLVDLLPPQVIQDLDQWLDHWRPWFLEQVKKDASTRVDWLKKLGYTEAGLAEEIEQRSKELRNITDIDPKDKELKKRVKKLRKLRKINASWDKLQASLSKNYVFFLLGGTVGKESRGQPYERENIRDVVVKAVYNASYQLITEQHPLFLEMEDPRQTNPHFFRNIGTTHERRHGDPSKREAFHKVLGNSVQEGDRTYNEMTPSEKSSKASGWWKKAKTNETNSDLIKFLSGLTPEQRAEWERLS